MNAFLNLGTLKEIFHIFTITLLSFLLPLSFLLVARLSTAYYLLVFTSFSWPPSESFLSSLILQINPPFIYALVFIISLASLVNTLIGKITNLNQPNEPTFRLKLHIVWIFLCTFQVCVGLGIQGTILIGVQGIDICKKRGPLKKIVLLLGLHETMLHWSRIAVKPVVDDTIFGEPMAEKWVEKIIKTVSCGAVWWLRLRDEIEALVLLAEEKKDMGLKIGLVDFVGWCLYYVIVVIGATKLVKSFMWIGMFVVCRIRGEEGKSSVVTCENDEKV